MKNKNNGKRYYVKFGINLIFLIGLWLMYLAIISFSFFFGAYWVGLFFIVIWYFSVTLNRIIYFNSEYAKSLTFFGLKKMPLNQVKRIYYTGYVPSTSVHVLKLTFNNNKVHVFESSESEYIVEVLNFLQGKIPMSLRFYRGFPIGPIHYNDGEFEYRSKQISFFK